MPNTTYASITGEELQARRADMEYVTRQVKILLLQAKTAERQVNFFLKLGNMIFQTLGKHVKLQIMAESSWKDERMLFWTSM